jgi:hypothetical protein
MDDIRERDLSRKSEKELTMDERRELARRFKEFKQLIRERGARNLGINSKAKGGDSGEKKKVMKWDPAAIAAAKKKKR